MTRRAAWDFGYEPPSDGPSQAEDPSLDAVVATREAVSPNSLCEALRDLAPGVSAEVLIARAPLFWTRLRASRRTALRDVENALERAAVGVRYVASARVGGAALPPALDFTGVPPVHPTDWAAHPRRPLSGRPLSEGQWFLHDAGGIRIDRNVCGTGAGMRLAVVDDDAADLEKTELDRIVCVGVDDARGQTGHAALMIGWAVGTLPVDGARFVGVAPDASVRVYCVPKTSDTVAVPCAVARAVFDGADAIVCGTYLEGTTSPMLDDALDLALHRGRRGRGTVVVLPTGRETSSPGASVHASLSLRFGDPASDPRVHCVAPGGRQGGWFFWRSPKGKLRPFSNRGPAVRWLSPGDDIAYPFSCRGQLSHAESSGAAAIAAGVLLLVLSSNRRLRLPELHAILARTVDRPSRDTSSERLLADPADLLPLGEDADGHNARTGYGRLNARRACACARDPAALALTALGEDELAATWCTGEARPYSPRSARWAVIRLLARPDLEHALRAVVRHARLIAADPSRASAHTPAALCRHLAIVLRELVRMGPREPIRAELGALRDALERASRAPHPGAKALSDGAVAAFGKRRGDADEAIPTAGLRS